MRIVIRRTIELRIPKMAHGICLFANDFVTDPSSWMPLFRYFGNHKRASSFTSYARVASFTNVDGFLCGALVRNEVGQYLEKQRSVLAFRDIQLLEPMTNEEVIVANRTTGSCLVVPSFGFSKVSRGPVNGVAIKHLVRWFEGNSITSLLLCVEKESVPFVRLLMSAYRGSSLTELQMDEDATLFRLLPRSDNARFALSPLDSLFGRRDLPFASIAKTRDRLIGRHFYEFDFRIATAVKCTLPRWSLNPDPLKNPNSPSNHGSASAHAWRSRVALDLKPYLQTSDEIDTIDKIRQVVSENPELLTLY